MSFNTNSTWSETSESLLNEAFPIHKACRDGDITTLANLMQEAPVAKQHLVLEDAYYGWTPSHWAAYFGRVC